MRLPKVRKIPQRTCIGCRETRPKKELIRIVRTPDSTVVVDLTGKVNGRGAYICPRTECLEAALKSNRLARALDVELRKDDLARIRQEVEALVGASHVE